MIFLLYIFVAGKFITMNRKIAITGMPRTNKTLLALALSNMTDIPYIRSKTMYEWRWIFGITSTVRLKWKDMLMIASSSFCDRAKTETYYDEFISDGASFSELMWMKSNLAKPLRRQQNEVVESLEMLCASYAARQYDFIIHAGTSGNDDFYVQMYRQYQIPFNIYSTEFPEQSLKEILKDIHVPVKNSVESSIYMAKTSLFIRH